MNFLQDNKQAFKAHKKQFEKMVKKQIAGVTSFLDGLVVYVLSREWHDLFSIYIFRLLPLPHCSDEVGVRFGFFGFVRSMEK